MFCCGPTNIGERRRENRPNRAARLMFHRASGGAVVGVEKTCLERQNIAAFGGAFGQHVGQHRTVPGGADRQGDRCGAAHLDNLFPGREGGAAVRGQIAARVCRIDLLDEQILDIAGRLS